MVITLKRSKKTGRFLPADTKKGFVGERYKITRRPGEPPLLLPVRKIYKLERFTVRPAKTLKGYAKTNIIKAYGKVSDKLPKDKKLQFYLHLEKQFDKKPVLADEDDDTPMPLKKNLRIMYPVRIPITLKQFKKHFNKIVRLAIRQEREYDKAKFQKLPEKVMIKWVSYNTGTGKPEGKKKKGKKKK